MLKVLTNSKKQERERCLFQFDLLTRGKSGFIFFTGHLVVGIISLYNSNSCLKGLGNTANSFFFFFFSFLKC